MRYFEVAKKADLPALIVSEGLPLRRQGSSYGSPSCPHCGTSERSLSNRVSVFPAKDGIWRWSCFSCGNGGSAVDYAIALWGVSDREAAHKLSEMAPPIDPTLVLRPLPAEVASQGPNPAVTEVVELIKRHGFTSVPAVVEYLEARGLPERSVVRAAQQGVIRMLPANPFEAARWLQEVVGEARLRAAGFWKAGAKWPAIAFRPLVFMLGDEGAEFRLARQPKEDEVKSIRYGRLSMPVWLRGSNANQVLIVEGGIDALSARELGWVCPIMGIPGCSAWRLEWFDRILRKFGPTKFVVALDGDEAGRKAATKIRECLQDKAVVEIQSLPEGRDWNDLLIETRLQAQTAVA